MRQKLTDLTIRQLKPPQNGAEKYWDESLPGFGVRVSQGGTKSFVVMYGKERRLKTLGRYPAMSLKTARRAAFDLLADTDSPPVQKTLSEALVAYYAHIETTLREKTVTSYQYQLKPLHDCTWETAHVPYTPHAQMAAKVFFNWAIRNGYTTHNPFAQYKATYGQRDRVLNDDEIRAVWHYDFPPFSNYQKLFLLTGLRKGEATYIEYNDHTLWISGEHTKNKHRHELPLTPLVQKLLPLPYFNGWSKGLRRFRNATGFHGFTNHDLRRTFATRHAALGTPLPVVSQLLNHRTGSMNPITRIYVRHNFLQEAYTAQLAYEQHIASIVGA